MKIKSFGLPLEAKAEGDQGNVKAIFATLNCIDKDGDVTLPGAFGEQHVQVVPAHDWKAAPIGKGRIYEQGDNAILDAKFYLTNSDAQKWFDALKGDLENGEPIQQYSYGFKVLESEAGYFEGKAVRFLKKLKVHEVSPVLVGAGEGTRTLSVKELKNSMPSMVGPNGELSAEGSWEETQQDIREAAQAMLVGSTMNTYISLEATFDTNVIICVYKADCCEPDYWKFDWTYDEANDVVTLTNPLQIERQILFAAKSGIRLQTEAAVIERSLMRSLGTVKRFRELATLRSKENRELSTENRERLEAMMKAASQIDGEIKALLDQTKVKSDLPKEVGSALLAKIRSANNFLR